MTQRALSVTDCTEKWLTVHKCCSTERCKSWRMLGTNGWRGRWLTVLRHDWQYAATGVWTDGRVSLGTMHRRLSTHSERKKRNGKEQWMREGWWTWRRRQMSGRTRNEGSASAIMMRGDIGGTDRGVERRRLKMGRARGIQLIYRLRFQLRRQPQHLSRTWQVLNIARMYSWWLLTHSAQPHVSGATPSGAPQLLPKGRASEVAFRHI